MVVRVARCLCSLRFACLLQIQGSAEEWSLGCVIPASWTPLAAGARFTQPRTLADSCRLLASASIFDHRSRQMVWKIGPRALSKMLFLFLGRIKTRPKVTVAEQGEMKGNGQSLSRNIHVRFTQLVRQTFAL